MLAHKIGHLECMKRLYGCLVKTKHFAIRYRAEEPDFSHLPKQAYEWSRSVYGNVKEEIPEDIPKPLEIRVIAATFLDANLLHDIVTELDCTLSTLPQQMGSQRGRPMWSLHHMVQNL